MEIVLTKDLNPKKGMVRGAVFTWPRATIRQISTQQGDDGWYKPSTVVETAIKRQEVRKQMVAEKRQQRAEAEKTQVLEDKADEAIEQALDLVEA